MRLIKLIAPTAMIATLALFAPHADAQTMGEYATTTASVGSGTSSMGSSIGSVVNSDSSGDLGGGSRTWGASSLGGSFAERAGAASGSSGGAGFDSRVGSSGSGSDSRWPTSQFESGQDRFSDTERFKSEDRFPQRSDASENRFPSGVLDQNRQGLDSHYSSSSGLDSGYSSSPQLDGSYSSN
jgi:hypothetical protein